MPNYYTHLKFGERVLSRLPAPLRLRLDGERAAFDLGCLGPDPLFFYRPTLPNAVRREGVSMHCQSALPAFRRLREALEERQPMAAGYAAGFLCHLALDSGCHGWVNHQAARGAAAHLAIEAEFDRFLMLRDGLDPRKGDYLPPEPSPQVMEAAARTFEHVSPAQMAESYRSMKRDTALLARLGGRRANETVNRVLGRLPFLRSVSGMLLSARPHPSFAGMNRVLERMVLRQEGTAAQQIARFFLAAEQGGPLDLWLDRDFNGEPVQEPAPGCRPQSTPVY